MTGSPLAHEDVARIRRTWAKAAAAGDIVGRIFYARLFEISPGARGMFKDDIGPQSTKLLQTLNWIVDHLDRPETLGPAAEALARRHVRYGVKASHYPAVGAALVATLAQGLEGEFEEEDAAAWGRVYGTLSELMIAAAYPAAEAD